MGKIKTNFKNSVRVVFAIYEYVLFRTELMRLDLTAFGSSGMERIVQKLVSEEINPRTDISKVNNLTECFGILAAGSF